MLKRAWLAAVFLLGVGGLACAQEKKTNPSAVELKVFAQPLNVTAFQARVAGQTNVPLLRQTRIDRLYFRFPPDSELPSLVIEGLSFSPEDNPGVEQRKQLRDVLSTAFHAGYPEIIDQLKSEYKKLETLVIELPEPGKDAPGMKILSNKLVLADLQKELNKDASLAGAFIFGTRFNETGRLELDVLTTSAQERRVNEFLVALESRADEQKYPYLAPPRRRVATQPPKPGEPNANKTPQRSKAQIRTWKGAPAFQEFLAGKKDARHEVEVVFKQTRVRELRFDFVDGQPKCLLKLENLRYGLWPEDVAGEKLAKERKGVAGVLSFGEDFGADKGDKGLKVFWEKLRDELNAALDANANKIPGELAFDGDPELFAMSDYPTLVLHEAALKQPGTDNLGAATLFAYASFDKEGRLVVQGLLGTENKPAGEYPRLSRLFQTVKSASADLVDKSRSWLKLPAWSTATAPVDWNFVGWDGTLTGETPPVELLRQRLAEQNAPLFSQSNVTRIAFRFPEPKPVPAGTARAILCGVGIDTIYTGFTDQDRQQLKLGLFDAYKKVLEKAAQQGKFLQDRRVALEVTIDDVTAKPNPSTTIQNLAFAEFPDLDGLVLLPATFDKGALKLTGYLNPAPKGKEAEQKKQLEALLKKAGYPDVKLTIIARPAPK